MGIQTKNFSKYLISVACEKSLVEQIWLMERLSTWMVRLLERLSA